MKSPHRCYQDYSPFPLKPLPISYITTHTRLLLVLLPHGTKIIRSCFWHAYPTQFQSLYALSICVSLLLLLLCKCMFGHRAFGNGSTRQEFVVVLRSNFQVEPFYFFLTNNKFRIVTVYQYEIDKRTNLKLTNFTFYTTLLNNRKYSTLWQQSL